MWFTTASTTEGNWRFWIGWIWRLRVCGGVIGMNGCISMVKVVRGFFWHEV